MQTQVKNIIAYITTNCIIFLRDFLFSTQSSFVLTACGFGGEIIH